MAKVVKDTPLAELTLRKYEKPFNLAGRALIKKLCLSLGVLQQGDSRDVVVDVFHVLLNVRKQKKMLTSEEVRLAVIALRETEKLPLLGVAGSNIRRHLGRLRELFLVEKIKNHYCIAEFLTLTELFDEKIERFLLHSLKERVRDYLAEVDAQL
ncbi:MAG: hypothetical protein ABIH34_03505 [Nanoarchaeota archaeon]